MNLILAGSGMSNWTLLIILAVMIIVMIVPSIIRNKKDSAARQETLKSLKPGTTIITTAGVFGKILSVRETTIGKVYVIETGDGKNKSYMEIHENAIMNIDDKRDIVLDADGNDITFAEEDKALEESKLSKDDKNKEAKLEEVDNETTSSEENNKDKIEEVIPKKAKKASKKQL